MLSHMILFIKKARQGNLDTEGKYVVVMAGGMRTGGAVGVSDS